MTGLVVASATSILLVGMAFYAAIDARNDIAGAPPKNKLAAWSEAVLPSLRWPGPVSIAALPSDDEVSDGPSSRTLNPDKVGLPETIAAAAEAVATPLVPASMGKIGAVASRLSVIAGKNAESGRTASASAAAPGAGAQAEQFSPAAPLGGSVAPDAAAEQVTPGDGRTLIDGIPFFRLRLALGEAAPADSAGEPALQAEPAELEIALGLIARTDLDNHVKLQAIQFPFATTELKGSFAPEIGKRSAVRIAATGSSGTAVAASAFDPDRFGRPSRVPETGIESVFAASVSSGASGFRAPDLEVFLTRDTARKFFKEASSPATPPPLAETIAALGYARTRTNPAADIFAATSASTVAESARTESFDVALLAPETSIVYGSGYLRRPAAGDLDVPEASIAPGGVRSHAGLDATTTPTIRQAIGRAALSYGLSDELAGQLVSLLSSELDGDAELGPSDRLDVFFSHADEADRATAASELYFIRAALGSSYRSFYRYEKVDGTVAYFGPEGRSFEQFLLRSPVPSAKFESGFGMRRHPILGYDRMHSGVDWSAPGGTPILAAASGVVDTVGWNGDYGSQTVIRHDDGYSTSYSHQSGIADGIVPGAEVRQGQIIGYVGDTGLATGNHLHYEVMQDGVAIDPMQMSLPETAGLRGSELDAFLAERDRIDALLYDEKDSVLNLAAN